MSLREEILACRQCSRLAKFLADARKSHPGYANRPVAGFGDTKATLLIVGLAPGFSGANRTGRPFTGDSSGAWLYSALHEIGLASAPVGTAMDDGLELHGVFIANAVKCVPPLNKPTADEIATCRPYLVRETAALPRVKSVLTLGRVAHESFLRSIGLTPRACPFAHGAAFSPRLGLSVVASFHPSRQNTNTGRLTKPMWTRVIRRAAKNAGLAQGR
jgi:uracil-DNA glycosylase family 4